MAGGWLCGLFGGRPEAKYDHPDYLMYALIWLIVLIFRA